MADTNSLFVINFGWHYYQYHYHTRSGELPCDKCDEIYDECHAQMLSFLTEFLNTNNIRVALEEGGTSLDIFSELQRLSVENTILLEAIQSLPHENIFHDFVDITQEEVIGLIQQKKIQTCTDLRDKRAELRDPYIAKHAVEIFSRYPQENGLLVCAGRHFSGVTGQLETYAQAQAISLTKISLSEYPWYKTGDEIHTISITEEGHTCFISS